jgi:hypothetical protein
VELAAFGDRGDVGVGLENFDVSIGLNARRLAEFADSGRQRR